MWQRLKSPCRRFVLRSAGVLIRPCNVFPQLVLVLVLVIEKEIDQDHEQEHEYEQESRAALQPCLEPAPGERPLQFKNRSYPAQKSGAIFPRPGGRDFPLHRILEQALRLHLARGEQIAQLTYAFRRLVQNGRHR